MKLTKILIVENEIILANKLACELIKFGYQVVGIVDSGIRAITTVTKTNPDLILMDTFLKGNLDGITAAKKIKADRNTLPKTNNWRAGIPRLRKLLHTDMLLWGLGDRLLNIIENYIELPLLFHGIDLRRDFGNAPLRDARHWHLDIDDERMIKVIVYLNNVGVTGGPYEYISRSHTEEITQALNYRSGFISDEAISEIVTPQNWQTCTAKAGSIIITDPCSIFHRAKPAKHDRYSITFGYTSMIPKVFLGQFKLSPEEWQRITPQLNQRQIDCLKRSKIKVGSK